MNKLMGFFELRDIGIPTIDWKLFKEDSNLDSTILWTVRTAIKSGNDFNLPRKVGVNSDEAISFAKKQLSELENKGMVIYYPYFHACISGNIKITTDSFIIESVTGDLWNLVEKNMLDCNLKCFFEDKKIIINKGKNQFTNEEFDKIFSYAYNLNNKYMNELILGKDLLLEWSIAQNLSTSEEPCGDKYFVFYEMRYI